MKIESHSSVSETPSITDPPHDCAICPRLREFILQSRKAEPAWHNGPVATWASARGDADVQLLIVGLAPGLRGANRTGRPFTGDYAGDLLYDTLGEFGFAVGNYGASIDDGLELRRCAITNSVRCVPPENRPVGKEIANCRAFLHNTIGRFPNLKSVLTLGKIAHDSTVRALKLTPSRAVFRHGGEIQAGPLLLFSSYHCSRYNTNTGRLTPDMFKTVFRSISDFLESS